MKTKSGETVELDTLTEVYEPNFFDGRVYQEGKLAGWSGYVSNGAFAVSVFIPA